MVLILLRLVAWAGVHCSRRLAAIRASVRLVQVDGRADEPDVAKRLGEVAEQLAAMGVDLLGEQSDVVGMAEQPLEQLTGLPGPAGQGKVVDQPEAADDEGGLAGREPVVG